VHSNPYGVTQPAFNIDGTPMRRSVDIHGKAYRLPSTSCWATTPAGALQPVRGAATRCCFKPDSPGPTIRERDNARGNPGIPELDDGENRQAKASAIAKPVCTGYVMYPQSLASDGRDSIAVFEFILPSNISWAPTVRAIHY
jgi:hypothetical protein